MKATHKDCGGEVVKRGRRYYCLKCDDQIYKSEVENPGAAREMR